MLQEANQFDIILEKITNELTTLLRAKAGCCYFEGKPKVLSVVTVSDSIENTADFENEIDIDTVKDRFKEKLTPLLFTRDSAVQSVITKFKADENIKVTSLIYFPLLNKESLVGLVEIINPSLTDYLRNRISLESLNHMVQLTISTGLHLRSVVGTTPPATVENDQGMTRIVGGSASITRIKSMISRIATADSTVLLQGATGTGKNVFAQYIHENSSRRDMPFVRVNCAAIPENLLESELFGHEKGSFTGAYQKRVGKFERGHLGTIFLDEIGEVPLGLQAKLLTVLQDHEFERVGGNQPIKINIRVISATNKDLSDAARKGEFREDLFYRLNVVPIYIPSLSERIEDLAELCSYLIMKINQKLNLRFSGISEEALFLFKEYEWPGNIRELENILERAMVIGNGPMILPNDLPQEIFSLIESVRQPRKEFTLRQGSKSLWEVERDVIVRALGELNWNQSKAARSLGITRNHLRYRIKKYGIDKPTKM